MAYPQMRSMNSALDEGATDGKYKKVVNNRDCAEGTTFTGRELLDDANFGIHETPDKVVPGGRGTRNTPNYVYTREPDSTRW